MLASERLQRLDPLTVACAERPAAETSVERSVSPNESNDIRGVIWRVFLKDVLECARCPPQAELPFDVVGFEPDPPAPDDFDA